MPSPDSDHVFDLPEDNPALRHFLQHRRSNMSKAMGGPGPSEAQLAQILEIGARVPDHRKLAPWRFVIFEDEARKEIGAHIGSVFQKKNPELPLDRVLFESKRFLRAPLVIGVISAPKDCPRGTPKWEQQLSAGAVCYNLLLAAQSFGFGAQWLTEWFSFDADTLAALGVDVSAGERVAGFIYIGIAQMASSERARPDVSALTSRWRSA